MREGWTNCADCKFLEPDSLYCQQMLRSVNLGCPYGQEKVVMAGAERGAGKKAYDERIKRVKESEI